MLYWYKEVFKNTFKFEGRARRKEFWYFILTNVIIGFVLGIISSFFKASMIPLVLISLFGLIVFLPSISVSIRRLHDKNFSGYWILFLAPLYLLGLVDNLVVFFPDLIAVRMLLMSYVFSAGEIGVGIYLGYSIIAFIVGVTIFILALMRGTIGDNKYGSDPVAD